MFDNDYMGDGLESWEEAMASVNKLAFSVLGSLRTEEPVVSVQEYRLSCLLNDSPFPISVDDSPCLRELAEWFLDNPDDTRAWNLRNMLTGAPML